MARLMFVFTEMTCAAVVLVPVMFILHRVHFHSVPKTVFYTVFALYLAAVYALVGLPTVNYIRFEANLSLVPIVGIVGDVKNSILNVLLFIPFGFLLPCLCADLRSVKRTVMTGAVASLGIELLQIFTFRATDINDLITNTLGTLLGYFLAKGVHKRLPGLLLKRGSRGDLILSALISFNTMFFVQPFLSAFVWNLVL